MKIFFLCLLFLSSSIARASEDNDTSASTVNEARSSTKTYKYNFSGYTVKTTKDLSKDKNALFPESITHNNLKDAFFLIESRAKALGLGDIPFEVVRPVASASADVTTKLVNAPITNQLFQDSYALKKGGQATVGPTGIYYNGNGVLNVVSVKSGIVAVDLMKGVMIWEQVAVVNKNYTSGSSSTGYPGYYGARATCLSKAKCKFTMSTFIIN